MPGSRRFALLLAGLALLARPPVSSAADGDVVLASGTATTVRLERGIASWRGRLEVPKGTTRFHVLTASRQM